MEREPRISVVMSVYNAAKYLREAVDSILNQTFSDFEFIIIDDKSTDDSLEIIKSYDDSRIILIANNENVGLTKNLNIGLKLAKGEFIARMDADDISLSNRFEEQIQFIKDNRCNICFSQVVYFKSKSDFSISDFQINSELIESELLFRNPLAHSTVMWDRLFFEKNNLNYNDFYRYSQDYELWTRVSLICKIFVINKPLVIYRIHRGQIGDKSSLSQIKYFNIAQEKSLTTLFNDYRINICIDEIFKQKMTKQNLTNLQFNLNYLSNVKHPKIEKLINIIYPRLIFKRGFEFYNLKLYFVISNFYRSRNFDIGCRKKSIFLLKCIVNWKKK